MIEQYIALTTLTPRLLAFCSDMNEHTCYACSCIQFLLQVVRTVSVGSDVSKVIGFIYSTWEHYGSSRSLSDLSLAERMSLILSRDLDW